MVMLHIKLKVITKCSDMVPHDTRGWGQKVKFQLFQDMVLLHQNKGNHECNNMVANILPPDPPHPSSDPWMKFQLFESMVMLHIKLKGITNEQHGSKYFTCIPPAILRQNFTLYEHGHVAYQIKGITNAATWWQIFYQSPYTHLQPVGWIQR